MTVSVVVTSLLTSSQETPNRPHPTKAPTQNKDEKNEGKRRRQKTKQQQEKINPGYKSISFVTHIDYSMSTDFSSLVSISKLSSTTLVENARDSTNMQESTDPVSPSALAEVLKHWRTSCLAHSKTPEDLCKDAKTFFGYLVRNTQHVTDNDVVLVTRSSHEEALAILIQELGVAFSSSKHMARVCALNVLAGALQGCSDSQLSNSITNLLGTFLLSHCGPIDVDEYGDDFDEQIRDAAVMGLTGLVCLPTSATANDDLVEAVKMRVTFAQQGVERRCAEPEEDEDVGYDHGFGRGGRSNDIRGGLSTLPRSKRSMCFDLVRSAVSGVAKISPPSIESALVIQPLLMEFATFSANCLQGESDPRCLLQLLQLLNALQLAFQPLFVSSKNAETVFPTSALFDAVAPYFPIQFTPPPNNIHGISRIGLHSALVSVLIYTSFDVNAKKHNRHSMLDLSAGLFLEQLLPLDPEEKPSVFDQLEAVECLTTLLFPIDFNGGSHCYQLEPATVRNMSQALIAIHNESSLAVAQGGEIGEHNKRLADTCRTFVSKVAFQLELATNKVLWETFVAEPLSKSASRLRTAPAASRTAIAYVACLAASGGSKTLRYCLGSCLDPLIEVVADKLEDRDNAAAAAHGIGAFFSSCRVAMDRAKKQGVALHPHPLEPYSAKAFQALYAAFDLLKEAMDEDGTSSLLVRIGTIRALESVLVASSSDQFEADDNQKICDLAQELLSAIMCSLSAAEAGDVEWKNACALTLGSLIGRSLDVVDNVEADSSESSSSVLATETIRTHMQATIYPELLASVTREVDTLEASRYDRKALALACKSSTTVAKKIVSSLLRSLSDALQQNKLDEASFCHADALSFVLRQGGDLAIQAYHDDSNSENIISKLSSLDTKLGVKENTNRISIIDNLVLPATMEEREASKIAVLTANKIIGFLLPAYQKFAPRISVQKMMHHVAKRIPPLSDSDNVSLCVRLPLLAAFLHGVIMDLPDQDDMEMEEAMDNKLTEITPALAEYVLSSDYESKARSAAASCLHATITSYSRGSNDCPAIKIVTDVINPSMKGAMGKFKAGDQSSVAAVKDCFNLFALVVSVLVSRSCLQHLKCVLTSWIFS